MVAPAAPVAMSLSASHVLSVPAAGLRARSGLAASEVRSYSLYGAGRRNFVSTAKGWRSGGASSALRVRRLLLASPGRLTYSVAVSTSSVSVKAFDSGDSGLPMSSKPVMTLQDARESELKPPPLKPAPKPLSRPNGSGVVRPQQIASEGEDEDEVALKPPPRPVPRIANFNQLGSENDALKDSPRPVVRLNGSSSQGRSQQGSESPSLGQVLDNVEKLGRSEGSAPPPRGGGRGPVRARTMQPGAWKAGDKLRTKAEREKDAADAAAAAAAERRAERTDNDDAQASTSSTDSEVLRTQRPRMQLNTLAKPTVAPRKVPVLKDMGSSGPKLRDVGAGPILKDVGAGPRSQSSRSSAPSPVALNAGPAGPPKPFSKPAIKVNS